MPRLCGTWLKSRYSSSGTIIARSVLRRWEVAEHARTRQNGQDGADTEQEQHEFEDVVFDARRRPVFVQGIDRDDADDEAAGDGAGAFENSGVDVHANDSLYQIEYREQHDPDDVHEVPVERARRDAEILRAGVDAGGRLHQQHGEITGADENVEAVHAGQREERRAEDAAAPPAHVLAEDQVGVFVALTPQEAGA